LSLSQANLLVSKANLALAEITLSRDRKAREGTAPETIDQDQAQVKTSAAQVESAKASIQANQATVQQFADLQSFQKIIAPFPVALTARCFDRGQLIIPDTPGGMREIFPVMQPDPLGVYVNVPKFYAPQIVLGQDAVVYKNKPPKKKFPGRGAPTAN